MDENGANGYSLFAAERSGLESSAWGGRSTPARRASTESRRSRVRLQRTGAGFEYCRRPVAIVVLLPTAAAINFKTSDARPRTCHASFEQSNSGRFPSAQRRRVGPRAPPITQSPAEPGGSIHPSCRQSANHTPSGLLTSAA